MHAGCRLPRLRFRVLLPAVSILVVTLISAVDLAAQAQATTGIIRGIVRDPAGAGVAGAAIRISHRETGFQTTVETTSTGVFLRTLLPVGTYDVTARALGQFGDEQIQGLVLRVGETLDLVITFKPVALSEITVTGERAPLIDTEDVTSSQRLSAEVVDGLPNNGRNYLDYTQLTPGVQVSQGPDGDELNVSGQRGIFNNITVDGADFNNPFFGEQRGGQRPAFTFNQDAVEELVVVSQGAPAEFGRSAGGFVNVITKSGTNTMEGSAHYFGQFDGISAEFPSERGGGKPDFTRSQFGVTLGGPIVRDKAFFFFSYDQQEANETKQFTRNVVNPGELQKLNDFLQTQWPGLFTNEFGPIGRTNDNRALLAKFDFNLNDRNRLSLKYNYTWSRQVNGTFDVDSWGLSANGTEKDFSNAVNGSLASQLSNTVSNEFRFQYSREDRPRKYDGPILPGSTAPATPQFAGGAPFPDIGIDFTDGFRIGLPFFLPIDPGFDTRVQLLDNVSVLAGDHLLKGGIEFNRTRVKQQFVGFANGLYKFNDVDGFINFVTQGNSYVTCSDGSDSAVGVCPPGTTITGPINLFLQSATTPGVPPDQLGLQSFTVKELALFVQDTWKVRDNVTLNLGLRWEGTWHPNMFVRPEDTFFAPFLSDPAFPSDGTIPDDLNNFQPRFGLAWDVNDDGNTLVRLNAGSYFSRIPMLVFAQHRTTNGAFQQTIFRSSDTPFLGDVPQIGDLIDGSTATPFDPDIQVADRNLELPRTWSFSGGLEQKLTGDLAATFSYQHARTDNLFRFINRNDAVFGSPFGTGLPGGNGIGALTVTESSARSRYNAMTLGFKGRGVLENRVTFEGNYTVAWDRSDDDNERDPFTIRPADQSRLGPEYNWSDRDRRHQVNGYVLVRLPGDVVFNNVVRYASSSPVSENCDTRGTRANSPADRLCSDGTILKRNTLRRDNAFFMWDLRFSKSFKIGHGQALEPIFEVFNLTNADNFLDTAQGSLLFNFDGTIRSGLGDTRRAQLGVRFRF